MYLGFLISCLFLFITSPIGNTLVTDLLRCDVRSEKAHAGKMTHQQAVGRAQISVLFGTWEPHVYLFLWFLACSCRVVARRGRGTTCASTHRVILSAVAPRGPWNHLSPHFRRRAGGTALQPAPLRAVDSCVCARPGTQPAQVATVAGSGSRTGDLLRRWCVVELNIHGVDCLLQLCPLSYQPVTQEEGDALFPRRLLHFEIMYAVKNNP